MVILTAPIVTDPLTSLLSFNWVDIGGWSLFIGLAIFIVLGAFREIWVPGARVKKLEATLELQAKAIEALTTQNGQLITSNGITEHFFKATTPQRGGPANAVAEETS